MRSYRIGKRGLIAISLAAALALAAAAAVVALTGGTQDGTPAAPAADARPKASARPRADAARPAVKARLERRQTARRRARLGSASGFAAGRDGRVAFAIAGSDGVIRGHDEHERFQSASLVKAMILAAELQRVAGDGGDLDPAVRDELQRMITVSDNDAASSVFARVGPEGLDAIARRAGMDDFESSETWGASEISAADMAKMFDDLGRVFPTRYEKFGLGLLGSIVPDQSWGIPEVATPRGWSVRFKGGWRPDPDGQIVNQAAELRRDGTVQAIAVLSDRGPSMAYGIETVEGVADRLLRGG